MKTGRMPEPLPVAYHVAGPVVDCKVHCSRCGCLLVPAMTRQSEVWVNAGEPGVERFAGYVEIRSAMPLGPSEGEIVGRRGDGPYFGQFVASDDQAPTCAAVAVKAVA